VKKVKAKRLAFDGIDSLFSRFQNKEVVRQALRQIIADLRNMGVTVFMSSEKPDSEEASGRYTIEEFVADGVIDLALIKGQQRFLRRMFVLKIRGADFRSGIIDFSITSQGLEFYPKIPDDRRIAKTNFEVRKKYGIPALDAMLGGGLPQGHMVLVSGNTGTGKTIFSLQFLVQGIREGENAVFVTLEEPVAQLKKMARSHGWNLDRYQEEGKLTFITADPMDVSTDKLLHEIVCAVDRTKAKRVVVDSISTLHSATLNEEQVRQFMIQLSGFLKARGVTGIFNYLFQPSFGASRGQLLSGLITNEMRLSSIIDGIVMLLYVERGQRIKKLLTVLKMRGIRHSRDIFNYEIETGGIKMGEKYEE
jgi:circadian clock protein KaiC